MYRIEIRRSAETQLSKLPKKAAARIAEAIDDLAQEPRPHGCKKLKGGAGYRVRVGSYRIIYTIEDDRLVVCVVNVAHRKDAYR